MFRFKKHLYQISFMKSCSTSKADVVAHQIDNDYARLDTYPIKKKILRIITNMPWERLQYIRFLEKI